MRALVGIDDFGTSDKALRLVAKLGIEGLETTLAHCVESVLPDGTFPELGTGHALARMVRDREVAGEKALEKARQALEARGIAAQVRIEHGSPSVCLLRVSDEIAADLTVVGCSNKGRWGSWFFGSVSQAVVSGARRHLAVAKSEVPDDRPLTAVFATDHSPYANRCLDAFLDMGAKGIGRVHVLTANQIDAGMAAMLVNGLPDLAVDAERWVSENLLQRNQGIADRLQAKGVEASPMVIDGHPNQAIHQAMEETGADLLVLGAQGHGFIERLTMGSVSFYQAVSERHSVLILRP
ncbi:MAG: universal stress protein [Fimbriimonas sp.]